MECNDNLTHKFVIMDFEFSMINKTSIVLISGAISNSLDRFKIRTLEGRPLLLAPNEEVRPMRDQEFCQAIKKINQIFKCNNEFRDACLKKLNIICSKNKINNLTPMFIENYILKSDNEINVLVLWNGDSNKRILSRLGIKQFPILNIVCCDKLFNQTYSIQLEKIHTKEIIFEVEIGTFNKTRRMLNLEETHDIICSKNHKIKYANDPRTNVKFIKCIFDYVIRKQRYENLIKHFI
uniref:Exonuclease domain-containing protein n=1 Tax=Schizaphis graminum TaxID=13262 RepID=A0A2S2PH48_SCHGA